MPSLVAPDGDATGTHKGRRLRPTLGLVVADATMTVVNAGMLSVALTPGT